MNPRLLLTAAAFCTAALASPAVAGAAGVSVTNDAGQPVALTEGTPLVIRQMAPAVALTFSPSEKSFTFKVTGPDGKSATIGRTCVATSGSEPEKITYAGNGTYAVQLITYSSEGDFYCEGPATTQNFSVVINGSLTLAGPKSPLLYRAQGGSIIEHLFTFDRNPGAESFTILWAFDAKLGAGNALLGEYEKTDLGQRTLPVSDGTHKIGFPHAGLVTVLGGANAGNGSTPNSALVLKLIGPFDWSSTPGFTGGRYPSYKIGGEIFEPRIAGQKVAVLVAKGSGKFKPFKTLTIPATRAFKFTYKQKKTGKYRFKYVFKGSEYVAAGAWIQKATLKKRSASISSPVPAAP